MREKLESFGGMTFARAPKMAKKSEVVCKSSPDFGLVFEEMHDRGTHHARSFCDLGILFNVDLNKVNLVGKLVNDLQRISQP